MLEFLRIQGLALIDTMELEFTPGMNVLTGETGAGKSFILKSLNFLLGEKMSVDMIRQGHEKAQVEAIFIKNGEELLLRRELMADTGRSRLYINGVLSSQDAVRQLRDELIIHTSQHGQQKLLQSSYQAKLVDAMLPKIPHEERDLLHERNELLTQLQKITEQRTLLQEKYDKLAEKRDLLEMQQHEIDKVAPEPGEEDKLENLRSEARLASTMAADYEKALQLLHGDDNEGLISILGQFERTLENICSYEPKIQEDLESVAALRQALPNLESRLRKAPEASSLDMDALEARLYALSQLKRKLHRSLDEILQLRQEIDANISFLDSCSLDITQLARQEDAHKEKLKVLLSKIIPLRRKEAKMLTEKLEVALQGLGFSKDLQIIADFAPYDIWQGIQDEKARLLWAPNPGQAPQPLDKIASGGELSRFLLALVSINTDHEHATYIFDEVDAGIGGITLNMVADRLKQLASQRQMLLITHWPQLAANANSHFFISKHEAQGSTLTQCQRLDSEARVQELARMAGGGEQGQHLAKTLSSPSQPASRQNSLL